MLYHIKLNFYKAHFQTCVRSKARYKYIAHRRNASWPLVAVTVHWLYILKGTIFYTGEVRCTCVISFLPDKSAGPGGIRTRDPIDPEAGVLRLDHRPHVIGLILSLLLFH